MTINPTWRQAIREAMERLVGTDRADEIDASWEEHAERERVEVTFFGPYSSGKSTLLRRLVVDGGETIPTWLTVSARRETFELNAIDIGDLTFTDSPGFAAGSALHDELSEDALALTDVFLLVLPPQLITTNRELVGAIASGGYFFGEPAPGTERAIIAVIAQVDSMGIDPDDDVDGMRALVDRKRSELVDQLEKAAGSALPRLQVFCVAADPYEEQARQSSPQRIDFDPYREWDGMDSLSEALNSLSSRRLELRRAAEVRYWCLVGRAVASQAHEVIEQLEASAEELRARHAEWAQQKSLVEAVVHAAEADLRSTLVALARTSSVELSVGQTDADDQLQERMTSTLSRWSERWDSKLDLALGEAEERAEDRMTRPRAERTEAFLKSLSRPPAGLEMPPTTSRVLGLLAGTKESLDRAARHAFEAYHGKSLDRLVTEAKRAPAQKAAGTTEAAAIAEATMKRAVRLEAALQLTDAILTIVTVVDAERRQNALDKQLRVRREEAQERIEADAAIAAAEIVGGIDDIPGWRARADAALQALRDQLELPEGDTAVDDLMQTVADQKRLIADLESLISDGAALVAST